MPLDERVKVHVDAVMGRTLVVTKRIAPGEVVVTDTPALVWEDPPPHGGKANLLRAHGKPRGTCRPRGLWRRGEATAPRRRVGRRRRSRALVGRDGGRERPPVARIRGDGVAATPRPRRGYSAETSRGGRPRPRRRG